MPLEISKIWTPWFENLRFAPYLPCNFRLQGNAHFMQYIMRHMVMNPSVTVVTEL